MSKISRRQFMATSSCGAYVLGLAAAAPAMTRKVFSLQDKRKVEAKEKWGRIEKLGDNYWAVISTPFDNRDFTTLCNGGIIAGKDRIVAIESYMQPKGAGWVASWAKKLTGRWPTDIVVTHFHADHAGGAPGFFADGESPNLWMTKPTHENVQTDVKARNARLKDDERIVYPKIKTLAHDKVTEIDLGGKKVKLSPTKGHTSSDVSVELVDPNIMFCGDLFFNRMIPNYRDSFPRSLTKAAKSFSRSKDTIYVPGHGPVADNMDLTLYQDFLGFVERSAKEFFDGGKTEEEAAEAFKLADKFRDWYIFSDAVVPRAMSAWYREFKK